MDVVADTLCRTGRIVVLAVAMALSLGPGTLRAADDLSVASPDGSIQFRLTTLADTGLAYEIRFKGRPVIETSRVGMMLDGVSVTTGSKPGKPETFEIREKYPRNGAHAEAVNHCKGARIPLCRGEGG